MTTTTLLIQPDAPMRIGPASMTDLHRLATHCRDRVLSQPRPWRQGFALGYLQSAVRMLSTLAEIKAAECGVDQALNTPSEVEYTLYLCTVCDHDCQSLALSFADWMAQR